MAFGNVYKKITNVLLSLLMIAGLFTVSAAVDSSKYEVKAEGTSTTLVTGQNFNQAIKRLAGNSSAYYGSTDTTITSFGRSTTAPSPSITTVDISRNQDGSIVAWFDDGTIYWYSEEDTIYMSKDSGNMFTSCTGIVTLDLSDFDTSNVTDMGNMFSGCKSLTSLNLDNFITSNVTNMSDMFYNCNSITSLDLSGFDTSNVTNMRSMFYSCGGLRTIYAGTNWNTDKVTSSNSMFKNDTSLVGELGTAYDASHTDKEYARIDAPGVPGYLTYAAPVIFPELEGQSWTIVNEPYHSFNLLKTSSYDGTAVQGAVFNLSGESDYGTVIDIDVISEASGLVKFEGLEPGIYLLVETQAPEHFVRDETERFVTVRKDGTVKISGLTQDGTSFPVVNQRLEDDQVVITKKWQDGLTGTAAANRPAPNIIVTTRKPELGYRITYDANGGFFGSYTSATTNTVTYNFIPAETGYDAVITSGEVLTPTAPTDGFVLEGWYTDQACTAPLDLTKVPELKYITVYAKYKDARVFLTTGMNFNQAIKRLAGNSSAIYSTSDTAITAFERSATAPAPSITTADISKNQDGSVIAWFDNGTIYWYSEADTVYMNEDSLNLFYNCTGLNSLDLSSFDTSNVTNMCSMFNGCASLTELDLSNFDTSNATNMNHMFDRCSGITSLDVSNFDTSNVTNMSQMFYNCTGLTSLDVSNFDTSKVTNMYSTFYNCRGLTSLDVSNFDTSKVTNMSAMFNGCSGLASLDVSGFDTSNVTSMSAMFNGCSGLASLDVSGFDTSNVTSMSYMFSGCSSLTDLDVSGFDTSKVTKMERMFYGCNGITSLDVSNFDTSKVTNMSDMFFHCTGLTSLDVSRFDTSNVTNMSNMFNWCKMLTSLDVSNFETSNVTSMSYMFYNCKGITALDVSGFDTSKVTSMSYMFCYCTGLTTLDVSNFDTSNVTSMSYMFSGCSSLTDLDVSGFDTSKATSMDNMFNWCEMLTSLDVSDFDTSKVTNMSYMFNNCRGITSLDVSSFDTSNVTDMGNMFYYCNNLATIYAGTNWNTDKVTSSINMFNYCRNLIGGAGTTYNSSKVDKTYAHIDGGTSNPGYLTAKN